MPFDFDMNSISPVESGGGVTPTGTISITENGTYDVTSYASADVSVSGGGDSKYGATADTFLGDVDANGVLQLPTEQSDLVFTGVTDVAGYGLYYKFYKSKVKSVSFPELTTLSESNACASMLQGCTALTSVSFPELTTISGLYACASMLQNCTALTSVSFPNLTTLSGGFSCQTMLKECTALTSVSFPSLTTISGGSNCDSMLHGCKALTDIYFNSLKTTSFGSFVNQFSNMMRSTGSAVTHTLHFPSNLQSTISGLTGYPNFGGTSGHVVLAFDLPATE